MTATENDSVRLRLVIDHPATGPLRSRSPETLHEVLVATLVDDEQEWLKDWRDLLMALAPFHHRAQVLGLDAAPYSVKQRSKASESARDGHRVRASEGHHSGGMAFSADLRRARSGVPL